MSLLRKKLGHFDGDPGDGEGDPPREVLRKDDIDDRGRGVR